MPKSEFPKRYLVQNDTITVSEELHSSLNELARRFYAHMGYSRTNQDFDYSKSQHPQEQMVYMMALEAAYMQQQSGALDD
ncbi:hypothetical protein ACK2J6_001224 [Vibrio fluvialis]